MYKQELGPQVPRGGNAFTRWLGHTGMRMCGWRITGELPNAPKFIIAVAPHSSNYDFLLTVGVIWGYGLRASFLAKQSLFKFPLGLIIGGFGGIPVDRSASHGVVEQMTTRFNTESKMILGIAPEGTRGSVNQWKRGFAEIAKAAQVPVVPAIINYDAKTVRFAELVDQLSDANEILEMVQQEAATGAPRRLKA